VRALCFQSADHQVDAEVELVVHVVDPQAHLGMPSRRRAPSAGTNVVSPAASRARHASTAAVSSASSSSWEVAACSRARSRRKSATDCFFLHSGDPSVQVVEQLG